MKLQWIAVCVTLLMSACMKKEEANAQNNAPTVQYAESLEDFPNPERGFYKYSETRASAFNGLSAEELTAWKKSSKPQGANYSIYSTLIFRYYVLDIFKDKPISSAFLEAVNEDFSVARQTGFKLIPRFTYTLTQTAGGCPEGFICPPYGDAPKAVVLNHIAQLKNVLHENADVIAAVQMGFIGVWGEQYYTDYFGDASQNTPVQKLLDNNWQDRIDVLRALLDAVPKERMIQVRYPQIKQRFTNGITADINTQAMQESEAFSQSDKARIGFHNDCFLASTTDYGTFEDYGNSSSPRQDANMVMRTYAKADGRFVAVGGETCSDTYSPDNDCEPLGRAQTEMKEMHYSFLNSDYNNEVNGDWQTAGCMDSIKRNLGYRFVLQKSMLPSLASAGGKISFSFTVHNRGYASPYNQRPVRFILRSKADRKEYSIPLTADVRKWFTGTHEVIESLQLPEDLAKGEYGVYLFFPDQYASLEKKPEYSVRLANKDLWEAVSGMNSLNRTLRVE